MNRNLETDLLPCSKIEIVFFLLKKKKKKKKTHTHTHTSINTNLPGNSPNRNIANRRLCFCSNCKKAFHLLGIKEGKPNLRKAIII
ncbi:hypothetical protein HanIR_Chr15g0733181 [Helianthus annuus]|nr:hypothetical protein HanIR_Chr15g0733181 [Helianthus annuus]